MKFAFITPRYGADVGSGAEHACRLIAEQVCERHDVDVLTTCARDRRNWKNEYSEGADRVRGVLVRRFSVGQVPDHIAFDVQGSAGAVQKGSDAGKPSGSRPTAHKYALPEQM